MRYTKKRILFNIIVILCVFCIVGFALFKIIFGNKSYTKEIKYEGFHAIDTHWEKNNYIVPIDNILLPENADMVIGDYYYLEQNLTTKKSSEKCYFGLLKLQSIKKDRYVFFSSKIIDKSNLYTFSLFNSSKLMISPLTKEQYSNENHILNCQKWIKLNNYKTEIKKEKTNEISKKIARGSLRVVLDHCVSIPSKKYLVIESMNSEYFQLENDEIYTRVKLCAKKVGGADIHFQPIDGSSPFYVHAYAIATASRKNTKGFPTKNILDITHKKEDKGFLTKKNLPGW
ncbi:MAG: hypothetical protein V4591_04745 [Bdellovibrionota bacterium]